MQAIIPLLKESELNAYSLSLAGKTLLERAINFSKASDVISSLAIQTLDKQASAAASSLDVPVIDPTKGSAREAHLLVSVHYPFRRPANTAQLLDADASNVACITRHRHHPVGAFVAKKGRMDFSQTLDSAQWRSIDEKQYFQTAPSLALHYASGATKRAYLILDDISALAIHSEEDLALAQTILERDLYPPEGKDTVWKTL